MATRYDNSGSVRSIERTPQGGLRVPGSLTRSGVFTYVFNGKTVREYRPPEEVFRADSLATLANAPVTLRHPSKKVSPETFKLVSVGYLAGPPDREDTHVIGEVLIQDAEAVRAVESKGFRELSCGYDCDTVETPGRTDEGEEYDRIQTNIRYNHVALVPKGRAGSSVRLRLDSEDNQIHEDEEPENGETQIMTPEQIQKLMTDLATATARADAAESKCKQLESAAADLAAEKARADAAESKVKELSDPKRLDSAVEERASVVERARTVLPKDFSYSGKSNHEIRRAALEAGKHALRTDSADDEVYVRAFFDAVATSPVQSSAQRSDAADLRRAAAGAAMGAGDVKSDEDKARADAEDPNKARERFLAHVQSMGTGKLQFSKD